MMEELQGKDLLDRLKEEQKRGKQAEHAYEAFIRPFIGEKRQVMFEAFQAASIEDVSALLEIKRQDMAIKALEGEIESVINTGKMAAKTLAEKQEIKS